MLDKRYQVFITTSGKEMQPERVVISQTLIGIGFFSWGLEQRTPLSTAFARRQIDDCDYVLLLLGSQYGEQSVSGVSYLQLEYIYAVTKQKPVIVFMHESPDTRDPELQESKQALKDKFHEFRNQLQKEVEQVVTYRTLRDLELAVRSYMPQMLERYPVLGWVRPQSIQSLQDEIDRLKSKLKKVEMSQGKVDDDPFLSLPKVTLNDTLSFEYKMHAYQDGNFKELSAIREMSWADIFQVLSSEFVQALPEEYFSRVLNQYLNKTGLVDAQTQMPRAHAVSRAQINIRSLHIIKQQMRQNDWIVPVGRDERQRMLWQVTEKSLKYLKDLKLLDKQITAF
ncbi:DUF4062 domain-containing protein [Acinetobacter sp. 194]|uniref:DUF4062 domain-containing protein n=1 Tax=Acinetobacter shaoyimingii TaxID=2715164 RepID=UPI00140A0F0A|nr:DUF4062 domain-containing protein [Acinetobacter shaoyimingii]NHB56705.1 DUF4062 domain-containing protein [Acinetobacter shaoyimingii]